MYCLARPTSPSTRPTSHLTSPTSRLTRPTSPVTRPTSNLTCPASHLTRPTFHLTRPTSCLNTCLRLLILVYGFLTAIGEDYPGGITGNTWPGSAAVGTILLIIVGLLMCQSWIRAKCCPPKPLKYGVQKARWVGFPSSSCAGWGAGGGGARRMRWGDR